ncbi:MAG: MFS transporter, partial [Pseudomonadota bacterium]
GRVRLWGSLTFIVATFAGGAVIERLGGSAVGTLFFAAALGMTIAALALPQSSGSGGGGQPSAPSAGQIWAGARDLMRDRTLVLFLLGASLVQASHAVYYTFSAAHWVRGGLSGDFVSLLWAIGVVAEIVLFRYSGSVIARVGAAGLLLLGAAGGVLRWAVTAADPAWGVLIWVQPLHALTFGATHLAAIHFIAYRVPDANAGLAQALFATLSTGVVMGLAMLAAGQLYDAFAAGAYFAMAMFAAAGGLCGWMARAQARVART